MIVSLKTMNRQNLLINVINVLLIGGIDVLGGM